MKLIISLLVIILLIGIISANIFPSKFQNEANPPTPIARSTDFPSCVAAGNPVRETYPRQCQSEDQIFIENIGNEQEYVDQIKIVEPRPGSTITSPLKVTGQARGSWFFEAQFPIRVLDENGSTIGQANAKAESDWMTENFVPFTATITIKPNHKSGPATLIIEKDNPSGLPENAAEVRIPVNY